MKATICEKVIAFGNQRYKTNGKDWLVLMFGTYSADCKGIPSYRYMPIPEDRVPEEVKQQAKTGE